MENANTSFITEDVHEYLTRCNLCWHGWFSQTWSQLLSLQLPLNLLNPAKAVLPDDCLASLLLDDHLWHDLTEIFSHSV